MKKPREEPNIRKYKNGDTFLAINTEFGKKDHKMAGLHYEDIDIIYIKRNSKNSEKFKTIIKTKNRNKLVFNFYNGPDNNSFHEQLLANFRSYLRENSIWLYGSHSILTDIENVEIVETNIKKRRSKIFRKNKHSYEHWLYEKVVVKTKYGNKASTEKFFYEDNLKSKLAIISFSDRNYNRK